MPQCYELATAWGILPQPPDRLTAAKYRKIRLDKKKLASRRIACSIKDDPVHGLAPAGVRLAAWRCTGRDTLGS